MDFLSNTIVLTTLSAAILFILVWIVVGKFLFKPFLAILEEREERTSGDSRRAIERHSEVKSLVSRLEEQLVVTRLEGIGLRDKKVSDAKTEAQALVGDASEEARKSVDAARLEIERIKNKALQEISVEADHLSEAVVSKAKSVGSDR